MSHRFPVPVSRCRPWIAAALLNKQLWGIGHYVQVRLPMYDGGWYNHVPVWNAPRKIYVTRNENGWKLLTKIDVGVPFLSNTISPTSCTRSLMVFGLFTRWGPRLTTTLRFFRNNRRFWNWCGFKYDKSRASLRDRYPWQKAVRSCAGTLWQRSR
jgi:hypothetical protein